MEFEWNIFPGFTTLQLFREVQEFLSNLSAQPQDFTGRIIFMSMFNDISWGYKDSEKEMRVKRSARFYLCEKIFTRKMVILRTWIRKEMVFHSRMQTTKRMGQSCGGNNDNNLQTADTQSSDPRVHYPEECSRANVVENCQYTSALMRDTIGTVFRTIISVNQLSIYGAVSDLCEEYRICHVRMERLVQAEQSDQLFEPASLLMKTPTPSAEDPKNEWKGSHNKVVLRFVLMQDF